MILTTQDTINKIKDIETNLLIKQLKKKGLNDRNILERYNYDKEILKVMLNEVV